jgi:hypothetical protein
MAANVLGTLMRGTSGGGESIRLMALMTAPSSSMFPSIWPPYRGCACVKLARP